MTLIQQHFWLEKDLLDRINAWCKINDDSFSHFMRLAARSALNIKLQSPLPDKPEPVLESPTTLLQPPEAPSTPEKVSLPVYCDVRGCKSESVGNFRITTSGLDTKDMYLCKFHLSIAKREGEVREV